MELKREELKIRNQENMSVQGPRVLTKLVKERRSKGILLPFTVDVYRGRALVLTHFNSDNNGNNNENDNGNNEYKENDYENQNENYYGNHHENNIDEKTKIEYSDNPINFDAKSSNSSDIKANIEGNYTFICPLLHISRPITEVPTELRIFEIEDFFPIVR